MFKMQILTNYGWLSKDNSLESQYESAISALSDKSQNKQIYNLFW